MKLQNWLTTAFLLFASIAAWKHGYTKDGNQNSTSVKMTVVDPFIYDRQDSWVGEEAAMWCADPSNSMRMFGSTNSVHPPNDFYTFDNVSKFSMTGGRHWVNTSIPMPVPVVGDRLDPACAYGLKNEAFLGWMTTGGWNRYPRWGYSVSSSDDYGRSWSPPVALPYDLFFDRGFLAVDRGHSAYRGRLYVVGATMMTGGAGERPVRGQILVFSSDDSGSSFQAPTSIPTGVGEGDGVIHMGQIAVLVDGTLMISWTEGDTWGASGMFNSEAGRSSNELPGRSVVKFAKSHDGGKSFDEPIVVAAGRWCDVVDGRWVEFAKWYPSLAVDETQSAHRGQVYMAWNTLSRGRVEVVFARSTDTGSTWSDPTPIVDAPPFIADHPEQGPYSGMVTLAVNSRGVVGAFFYAQEKSGSEDLWPVFTASPDGGATWAKPIHLTKYPAKLDAKARAAYATYSNPVVDGPPMPPPPSYDGFPPTCYYGLVVDADDRFRVFALSTPNMRPIITTMIVRVDVPPSEPARLRNSP